MARIPRSMHYDQLKEPVVLLSYWSPRYGTVHKMHSDTDLEWRDLIQGVPDYDKELYEVGRRKLVAPDYCLYILIERRKMEELRQRKYGERAEHKIFSVG